MFYRVEVEFLSGPEDMKDRRIYNKVRTIEFVPDSHLRLISVDDGEMVVKWNRLQWYHSQPLDQLTMTKTIDDQVLEAAMDSSGRLMNKISGIKKHRELTGWGLKESKEYCDKLWEKHEPF